jgi:FKBP-type peptidyl-prolyl cis-trans isomerase FklB
MKIDMEKVSYILGQNVGGDFARRKLKIDTEIFVKSFKEAFAGEPCRMPAGEMQQIMQAFQAALQEQEQARRAEAGKDRIEAGRRFLEENKKREGVVETPSGLQYRIVAEGSGPKPSATDTVEAHYEGKTLDGKVFDSSIRRGAPASFPVSGVIPGWQEALPLMSVGARYELFIPSELAYGAAGAGKAIGPHETLIFKVELTAIKQP